MGASCKHRFEKHTQTSYVMTLLTCADMGFMKTGDGIPQPGIRCATRRINVINPALLCYCRGEVVSGGSSRITEVVGELGHGAPCGSVCG